MTPELKLPPHNRDAEKTVLGSILRHNQAFDDIALKLTAEDFYFDAHQKLYRLAGALIAANKPCDMVSVFEAAIAENQQKEVTAQYLAELWEFAPTAAESNYYAGIIREKATARRLIGLCNEILRDVQDNVSSPAEIVARFESAIFQVGDGAQVDEPMRIGTAMNELMEEIDERLIGKTSPYIPSGLTALDQLIGGFRPSELTILAARPSVGKSAFCLKAAINASLVCRKGVLVFSLEMRAREWAARVLSGTTDIPLNVITNDKAMDRDVIKRLVTGASSFGKVCCLIDDKPTHTVDTIAATARRAVRKHSIGMVIIDYLQLIDHGGYKSDNLSTRIGYTSRALKVLARTLNVPVICLAQLNRECEKRGDGRPLMSDLRDSGNIEQDADNVLLLWPQQNNADSLPAVQEIRVVVEKQRNGPRGEAHMDYVRALTRFQDSTPRM